MPRATLLFSLFLVGLSVEVALLVRQGRALRVDLDRALQTLHATQEELAKARADVSLSGVAAEPFQLMTTDGDSIELGAGPSFVVFFSTTCPACNEDAPIWGELYRDYADAGVRFVGVCVKAEDESAQAFADRWDVDFPVVYTDDPRVSLAYRADYLPRRILIDADGLIAWSDRADAPLGVEGEAEVREALEGLL